MQERQPPSAGSLVWTRGLVWLPDRSAQLDEALCSARLSCFSRFFFFSLWRVDAVALS